MATSYVDSGYLVDSFYVYQPIVTGMTTNWLFQWNNTSSLAWQDSLAINRTWEGAYDVGFYELTADEAVSFAEGLGKSAGKALSESFAFAEARAMLYGKAQAESFVVTEADAKNISQSHAESVAIADAPAQTVGKNAFESFSFAEALVKSYGMNPSESINFAEVMGKSVGFIREFVENFAVAEAVAKTYGLKKSEAFAIVDAWRRQGDMVISDMILASGNVTMEDFIDFMSYGNMPGYEKWRDFIPGDYEYREAMFRVVLESKNADRGLLTNLQATIDVPDMIDRGSATVVNNTSGAYVAFNRVFHIVPEITLASRSGSGTNPIAAEFYGTPTKTGFTARLRDTVTGAYVTGSFTWAAHGY